MGKLTQASRALHVCDEAGPCGYGIQRQLTVAGHECVVVAPTLTGTSRASASRPAGRDQAGEAAWHTSAERR